MNADEYKVLSEKVDTLQKSIDRVDKDLAHDRNDLGQLTIRIGAVESQIDELRKIVTNIPNKTQNKVEDALEPMHKEVKDLQNIIQHKKVMVLKEKTTSFWKKIFRGWLK